MSAESQVNSIRTILLKQWDPLSDEYDDLIPDVLELIKNHCTAEQLEHHLKDIEARWKSKSVQETSLIAKMILETVLHRTPYRDRRHYSERSG
jgi:argonaute-like protein implicated in RNA metabolism and viral defense